jgi:hypothetical protein
MKTLFPLTEIARRGGVCAATLKRRVDASNTQPDAVLISGRKNVPAYDASRVLKILTLCNEPEVRF